MEPIDLEIRRRLDQLKEPVQAAPSQDELEKRLQELKGLPGNSQISNKYIVLPKPRSQTEQVDDLMKQFTEEVTILSNRVSSSTSTDEIERRLKNLKSDSSIKGNRADISHKSDENVFLKKILAEADLEKKLPHKFSHAVIQPADEDDRMSYSESDSSSDDEFCTICDKNPKWICEDCDRDMYCSKCYVDFHDEIGETHRRKAYNRRKK